MLDIRSIDDLSARVGFPAHQIYFVANHLDRFVLHYELVDPLKPEKPPRPVISTIPPFRQLQDSLLRKVLLPRINPAPHNHGGVARRNITTNAMSHASSAFAWKTDLAQFFPSIHQSRVRELFATTFGCDDHTAGILTRLCTYDHHLAIGLPTSPLLADQITKRMDVRIAGLARATGLVYTRFVDDITLSGRFSLNEVRCRLPRLVHRIIEECQFGISATKTESGRLQGGDFTITSLRFRNGRLDVAAGYLQEVERQITDHWNLSCGREFAGPLMTRDMLRSRIMFIASIRPTRRTSLLRKFGAIDWTSVMDHAARRGLVVLRKQMRRVSGEEVVTAKFSAALKD